MKSPFPWLKKGNRKWSAWFLTWSLRSFTLYECLNQLVFGKITRNFCVWHELCSEKHWKIFQIVCVSYFPNNLYWKIFQKVCVLYIFQEIYFSTTMWVLYFSTIMWVFAKSMNEYQNTMNVFLQHDANSQIWWFTDKYQAYWNEVQIEMSSKFHI